ncbi:hypothetical protein MHU86_17057 [Fragilaria crotonensis]|nr:hypothetical protein MHU86_17057 [Fragilaria crotonensis]
MVPIPFINNRSQDDVASGALLTNADLEEAFTGLDYLNNLLPPPFGDLVLPDQLRGFGEMGSQERLDHSKSGGKTWMATRELQMMTSLLMRDGRYHTSVAILSFDDMQVIQRLLWTSSTSSICKEVQRLDGSQWSRSCRMSCPCEKRYGSSKEELYQKYDDQMNRVVKEVLLFYPGLLQKRLIVFPLNLSGDHWGQHLFSMLETLWLPRMMYHASDIFFFIAVFIPPAREKFQTMSVLSGS